MIITLQTQSDIKKIIKFKKDSLFECEFQLQTLELPDHDFCAIFKILYFNRIRMNSCCCIFRLKEISDKTYETFIPKFVSPYDKYRLLNTI